MQIASIIGFRLGIVVEIIAVLDDSPSSLLVGGLVLIAASLVVDVLRYAAFGLARSRQSRDHDVGT
jgi:hypothetical protein